jgi:hypothetical protein
VPYLEEINGSEAAWRKTLEVFDEQEQYSTTMSFFTEYRPAPMDVPDTIQVKLLCPDAQHCGTNGSTSPAERTSALAVLR